MRLFAAVATVARTLLAIAVLAPSVHAQQGSPAFTTLEQTSEGGWAGACEDSWVSSDVPFNARRVCRVAMALIQSWQPTQDTFTTRQMANQLVRLCWGRFPRSGGDCQTSNAWAYPSSWMQWASSGRIGMPQPAVITLTASELLQSEDEVAFLLAHEMGHAIDLQQTAAQSRQNEERADVLGIGFMVRAGYDARAAGRGLQTATRERGQGLVGNILWTLLTHAAQVGDVHGFTHERIAAMKRVFAAGCAGLNNQPLGCKEGWK